MRLTLITAVFGALLTAAQAAPAAAGAPADLGEGLGYFRVHELPADLPTLPGGRAAACVVDLRYARSGGDGAAALRAWARLNASPRTPIFILENSGTAGPLRAAFSGAGIAGLVLIAPSADHLSPDIAVQADEGDERKAYDAYEKGAALASLLSDYPDKPRVDEAYLEKEHIPDGDAPDPESGPLPPQPLVDRLLQRAVQLHHGLLALKRE
jgi:hypothetical protein